jgi:hypothetical protein
MHDNYANNCTTAAATPETLIETAFRDLAGNIEGVMDSIDAMERRFGRALVAVPPSEPSTSTGGIRAVEQPESPMLSELGSLKRRVIFANARLIDILQRAQI